MPLPDIAGDCPPSADVPAQRRLTIKQMAADCGTAIGLLAAGSIVWAQGRIIDVLGWRSPPLGWMNSGGPDWLSPSGVWWALAALSAWLVAEVVARRSRRTVPGIMLALLFAVFAGHATFAWVSFAGFKEQALPLAASGMLTAFIAHYLRFRLAFTALPVAVAGWLFAVGAASLAATLVTGSPGGTHGAVTLATTLVYGAGLFAWAVRLDRQSIARAGEPSEAAFWLHALAAPLVVLPLAGPLFDRLVSSLALESVLSIVLVLVVAAMLSLLANRAALLAAAVLYPIVAAAVLTLKNPGEFLGGVAVLVASLELAAIVLALTWRPLRARLLAAIPGGITRLFPAG